MTQYEKMTATPIPRLIATLSVPTIISMLVTNIYNLVDTAFVGRLGTSASGAVGIVFGFMAIIQAFGFMFGQGSGSIISRALGARDTEAASRTASTGCFGSFMSGAAITVIGFANIDRIVFALGSGLLVDLVQALIEVVMGVVHALNHVRRDAFAPVHAGIEAGGKLLLGAGGSGKGKRNGADKRGQDFPEHGRPPWGGRGRVPVQDD